MGCSLKRRNLLQNPAGVKCLKPLFNFLGIAGQPLLRLPGRLFRLLIEAFDNGWVSYGYRMGNR